MSAVLGSGLTYRQAEALNYLREYIHVNDGIAPSYEQISEALNLASKSSAHRLIQGLRDRGYVETFPDRARGIRLTDGPKARDLASFSTDALIAEMKGRGFSFVGVPQ